MSSAICFNLDQSKIFSSDNGLKELHESMNMCTGHHDITEILLKTVLKYYKINQSVVLDIL